MGWVDQIPRAGKLYIGGLQALYQRAELFKELGITHVLSVVDFNIYEDGQFSHYKSMHLRLEDDPNENLLEHFASGTAFIEDGIASGGAVFVHCAMGKSRSAAFVCAYLMKKDGVTPMEALEQVREGRPVCGPNPGFMDQLEVWGNMLKAHDETEYRRLYDEWFKERYQGSVWSWDHRSRSVKL